MIMRGLVGSRRHHVALAATILVALACAVRLVSDYDDVTDKSVSTLQGEVDTFLRRIARLKPPACTWARHDEFYDHTYSAVSTLTVRNRARPKNEITVQQIELLDSSLVTLERLHRLKGDSTCFKPEEVAPLRANFETAFTAILRFELAKKRG